MLHFWYANRILSDAAVSSGFTGTLFATLDPVVASGAGEVDISAGLAGQLLTVGVDAQSVVRISGSVTATLSPVALVANGNVSGASLSGSLASTLFVLGVSASGALGVSGSGAITLGVVASSGAGEVDVSGSLAGQLNTIAIGAAGAIKINGATAATLSPISVDATGDVYITTITGTLDVVLSAASMFAMGTKREMWVTGIRPGFTAPGGTRLAAGSASRPSAGENARNKNPPSLARNNRQQAGVRR